jgi:glycosyltransferase involved in cell wall biosynthesis
MSIETHEISSPEDLPEHPVVSVYMLTYRHERFISQAIESVLRQKCNFRFELIIGEDCSPDGTRDIVLDYQKNYPEYIRVLVSNSNMGSFANMERCLAAARGDYIAICEGDDFWQNPEKLQMQVDALLAMPDATLCHTDFDRKVGWRVKRNSHVSRSGSIPAQGDAFEDVLQSWTIMTATAMYRGDVLRNFLTTRFNDRNWPFGDYNKALFAAANGPLIYLPISTATWRKVSGSATNLGYANSLRIAIAYGECRERFMDEFPVSEDLTTRIRSISWRNIARRSFLAGRTDIFESAVERLALLGNAMNKNELFWRRLILQNTLLLATAKTIHTSIQRIGMLGG